MSCLSGLMIMKCHSWYKSTVQTTANVSVKPVAQIQNTERKRDRGNSKQAVVDKAVTHSSGKQSDGLQLQQARGQKFV